MFCSQIHDLVADMRDPLTKASAVWVNLVLREGPFEYHHFLTLYAFGKLRQSKSIECLTPGHVLILVLVSSGTLPT